MKLLSLIPDLIITPLAFIINMYLQTSIYPDLLELVKGGSTQDNNYQPISLLSIFDKIIEKLMHKRLYTFLEINIYYFVTNLDLEKTTQLYMLWFK